MSALRNAAKRTALRLRERPWLLAGSVPLTVSVPLVLVFITPRVSGGSTFWFWVGGLAVTWIVVTPLTTTAVTSPPATVESDSPLGPRELIGGVRWYPRLLARRFAGRLVTLPLLVVTLPVVGGTGLAVLSAFQITNYALGSWTFSRMLLTFLAVSFAVLALALSSTPLLFTTAGSLAGQSLREATTTSIGAFVARPMTVSGVALVESLLGFGPFAITFGAVLSLTRTGAISSDVELLVLLVTFVCTAVPLFAARAVFHEESCQRLTTDLDEVSPFFTRLRVVDIGRLALLGLLIGGLVLGGVAVRVADERPGSQFADASGSVPDGEVDANALVNASLEQINRISHVKRDQFYNRSTGRVEHRTVQRVEYPDGEFEVYYIGRDDENVHNWTVTGAYISPTTVATFFRSDWRTDGPPPNSTTIRSDGSWTRNWANPIPDDPVQPGRLDDQQFSRLERGDWRVVSRSEKRIVLEVVNYSAVGRREPQRIENGSALIFIDSKTGFVTRIEERWTFTDPDSETPERRRRVTTFRRFETNSLTRPPALGSQSWLQIVFDMVYY